MRSATVYSRSATAFEDIGLCPFCVQRYLMRFDLSSFFNVAEKPFVRALILLSYCLG
jgi:hypothetical protein